MSSLQIIEALCHLIEQQATIITTLALHLEEVQSLSDAEMQMVNGVRAKYDEILGAGDAPNIQPNTQ